MLRQFCEDLLVTLSVSQCLFWFTVSVFSRATAECYRHAAAGETRRYGAMLQESHGGSGTLAHHQK